MVATRDWQEHRGAVLDERETFSVIECETCGFRHVVPLPTPEELADVYAHDYYVTTKPLYLADYEEDFDWWRLVYSERYQTFESLLGPDRRTLVDIGSGTGHFLMVGAERGWEVLGIEPSVRARDYSIGQGLDVREGFFDEDAVNSLPRLDAVYASHVLEHVPDPAHLLGLARRVLAPRGVIGIIVPNDYSPIQRAVREVLDADPWWVAPPHHLNYFDFESLERLLRRVGFEVVARETTFPIDMFLLMGDFYIGNRELGRRCHERRKQLELRLEEAGLGELKRRWYRASAEIGIGRQVVLYARRVEDGDV